MVEAQSINTYLAMTALIAEDRPRDAVRLLTALEPMEQIDCWLAGCSVTAGFATHVAQQSGVAPEQFPAWLRAIGASYGDPE